MYNTGGFTDDFYERTLLTILSVSAWMKRKELNGGEY